jgi:hypothetical protein
VGGVGELKQRDGERGKGNSSQSWVENMYPEVKGQVSLLKRSVPVSDQDPKQ